MSSGFSNGDGKIIVERMIEIIHENRGSLSELDGAIGDGDHGINMDKGFSMAGSRIAGADIGMSEALNILGRTLVMEIGGAMGPLYGAVFRSMARASKRVELIDAGVLASMLARAAEAVAELGEAEVGDKTMVDTLAPAAGAVETAHARGAGLPEAVDSMLVAAEAGWKSTRDLVAKRGRSARLAERSRGVLDAGATSCYLLLKSMGETMKELCR